MTQNGSLNNNDHDKSIILNFLLNRVKYKGDFPAFSDNLIELNKVSQDKDASASDLARVILRDYSLTTKILKIVNSAYFFGQDQGRITTVTRAVVVLGFENIRSLASGLSILEHFRKFSETPELKEIAALMLLGGLQVQAFAKVIQLPELEEAFICGLLFNLGRAILAFYFPYEYRAIEKLIEEQKYTLDQAASIILNISATELGIKVTESWNFPETIMNSLKPVSLLKTNPIKSSSIILPYLTSISNYICYELYLKDAPNKQSKVLNLIKNCAARLSLTTKKVAEIIELSYQEALKLSNFLNLGLQELKGFKSSNLENIIEAVAPLAKEIDLQKIAEKEEIFQKEIKDSESLEEINQERIQLDILQEITITLLDDFEVNDILTMVVEGISRGADFDRVLIAILDKSKKYIKGYFGTGSETQELVNKLILPNEPEKSLLAYVMQSGKAINSSEISPEEFSKLVSEQEEKLFCRQSFVVVPIFIRKVPVGVIYADRFKSKKIISLQEVNTVKIFSNQASLAIEKKHTEHEEH